jgi:Cthe_2314-like HEPN
MSDLLALDMHPFVRNVLQKGVAVTQLLGDRHPSRVVPEYSREPDEHEFFLLGVSVSMVEVLNCCHQLHQIPILLTNHRQTASMGKAGINRHSQLVYHIENYLIRTQSLLDRILKLVDAVFHLTNDPRHCRYDVVMRNVKIQVSDILLPLKELKKVLDRYAITRNEIIHHHSITDDSLRRLDMYFLADRWERLSPRENIPDIGALIKETVFEVLWFKKREFTAFNRQMAELLEHIFYKLVPYYTREERALRARLAKPII